MSMLERLLGDVDIHRLALGELAEISTGSSNRKDESEEGAYPLYVRSANILKSDNYQYDEEAVIIPGEGGVGEIFHYVNGKYALHQRAYRISPKSNAVNVKYFYYYAKDNFKSYIVSKSVGATSLSIRKPMLEKYTIPIPCPDDPEKSLAIQAEIVRILDTFTDLTTELENELVAREKQYEYYRNALLDASDGTIGGVDTQWLPLGNLTSIKTGQAVSKQVITRNQGRYPVINSGREPLGFIDKWNTDNNPIGITTRGAGVGSITWQEGKYFRGNLNYSVSIIENSILDVRYLYYLLHCMQSNIKALCTFDGIPALNASNLKGLKVPIPCPDDPEKSLAIQKEIVRKLDKFTELNAQLTKEIELRKKQYEYYRDMLFGLLKRDNNHADTSSPASTN